MIFLPLFGWCNFPQDFLFDAAGAAGVAAVGLGAAGKIFFQPHDIKNSLIEFVESILYS